MYLPQFFTKYLQPELYFALINMLYPMVKSICGHTSSIPFPSPLSSCFCHIALCHCCTISYWFFGVMLDRIYQWIHVFGMQQAIPTVHAIFLAVSLQYSSCSTRCQKMRKSSISLSILHQMPSSQAQFWSINHALSNGEVHLLPHPFIPISQQALLLVMPYSTYPLLQLQLLVLLSSLQYQILIYKWPLHMETHLYG